MVEDRAEAVRRVVRGELPWRELGSLGIGIVLRPTALEVIGAGPPVVVDAADIACGWLRTCADEKAFREWARVVHGAVGLIELRLDHHPLGERVLECLWDAAFGDEVPEESVALMREVVLSGGVEGQV